MQAGPSTARRAFSKGAAKNCSYRFGSPLKISDRGYAAPMFTDASKTIFVYSSAIVFRAAAAKAYTVARTSQRSAVPGSPRRCGTKQADPKTFVRMAQTTSPEVGGPGGLESFYIEEAGAKNADGTEGVNAEYFRGAYRHGRRVCAQDGHRRRERRSKPPLRWAIASP